MKKHSTAQHSTAQHSTEQNNGYQYLSIWVTKSQKKIPLPCFICFFCFNFFL